MTSLAGGYPAVKFDGKGSKIKGTIVELAVRQATKFQTREPLTFKDGNPIMETVVTLEQPGGDKADLFVSSKRLRQAIQTAFREQGKRDLELYGELEVEQTGYETGGDVAAHDKDAKTFRAVYEPPFDPTV